MSSGPNPLTTDWVPLAGQPVSLAYKGDWAAGTYYDGDIVVYQGIVYECVGGPTAVAPDPSVWGASQFGFGRELAYAEKTSVTNVTTTSTVPGDTVVTAPSITLDGVTTIIIELDAPYLQAPNTGSIYALLYEDSTQLGLVGVSSPPGTGVKFNGKRRRTPSAGAHVYSFRSYVSGGTGGAVGGDVGGPGLYLPAFIRITQA